MVACRRDVQAYSETRYAKVLPGAGASAATLGGGSSEEEEPEG